MVHLNVYFIHIQGKRRRKYTRTSNEYSVSMGFLLRHDAGQTHCIQSQFRASTEGWALGHRQALHGQEMRGKDCTSARVPDRHEVRNLCGTEESYFTVFEIIKES